jgi:hypothetical protein
LLLLSTDLGSLHCDNRLLLFHFVFGFDLVDGVLNHLQQLLVRHTRVVAQQIHDLFALAYKNEQLD